MRELWHLYRLLSVLDAVPHHMAARSRGEKPANPGGVYRAPAWQWSLDPGEEQTIKDFHPNIAAVRDLPYPRGRGVLAIAPWARFVPLVRKLRLPVIEVRFGA